MDTGSTKTKGKFTKRDGVTYGRPVIWTEEKLCDVAQAMIDWLEADDNNIFFYKFFRQYKEYDLWDDIINEYEDKYESFSRLITRAKKIQEQKYIQKALENEHNAQFSMFLMKNKFNWQDKVEHNLTALPVSINFGMLPDGNTPKQIPITPHQEVKPDQLPSNNPEQKDSGDTPETN